MHGEILACVLVLQLVLAANGQSDDANSTNSDDTDPPAESSNSIVAASVTLALVLVIVVTLTITMWVCACCRPEKGFNRNTRYKTNKWDWKSTMPRATSPDVNRLPAVGLMEADDRRKSSIDASRIGSMDLRDSTLWRSNEDMTKEDSHDDLYASQNYVHAMNYSENENDFQALKLDEALFENPSRSRSEAQLPNVHFSNTMGLQPKTKKLDDLSNEKVLEFYDLHTPRNSPRRKKNKVSCSTGDLSNESSPSLSARNVKAASEQIESPLVNQQALTVTIEQTACTVGNVEDCVEDNTEQIDGTIDDEQKTVSNENSTADSCNAHQIDHASMPETSSLQEDNVSCASKENLREILTGTPDSGVVDSSNTASQGDQSVKSDDTSDVSAVTESKSETSSIHSLTHNTISSPPNVDTPDSVVTESPTAAPVTTNDTNLWEPVADRKKRYLQIVEHSKALNKSTRVSSSSALVESDSDYGNSDEESTTMLSSSQPVLNLTNTEDPKPLLSDDSDSSDSDTEEMQSPLVSTKLSPRDTATLTSYTNPLLSDSSDEECEMVQPGEVVIHQSPVKNATQDAREYRASHPPLQRTLNYEQITTNTGVVQHSKKKRHKPKLKSILEEDGDNT